MEKIYLKNGKEVQLGDILTKVSKVENPVFGEGAIVQRVVVTEGILPELIKAGIVTTKLDEKPVAETKVPMELDYYIEKSPEIYIISTLDGRITKANKAHIKNYRNFAAFRTIEDDKIACTITRDILKEMFKNNG